MPAHFQKQMSQTVGEAVTAPVPGLRRQHGEEQIAELPDPYNPPPGCAFAPRCPRVRDKCRVEVPPLAADPGGMAACFFPLKPRPDESA